MNLPPTPANAGQAPQGGFYIVLIISKSPSGVPKAFGIGVRQKRRLLRHPPKYDQVVYQNINPRLNNIAFGLSSRLTDVPVAFSI